MRQSIKTAFIVTRGSRAFLPWRGAARPSPSLAARIRWRISSRYLRDLHAFAESEESVVGGQVTGRAMVRPVRLGMIFEPSLEALRLATEHATLLWGGIYQPFLDPADPDRLRWEAHRLGVDVLWAVAASAASAEAARLTGFQWRGHGEWSPLRPARDYPSPRLLGPESMLDNASPDTWTLPRWAADDPLSDMFSVWFGLHGASEQGINLENWFAARAGDIRLDHDAALPADATSWITPSLLQRLRLSTRACLTIQDS
jgi:hypothetical protein